MPKAKSYPDNGEEPSTVLESQWEEEASTTIEQGQAADKLRPLGLAKPVQSNTTNLTHTGGLDESTVDDQQAQAALSAITPIRPELVAHLVITQGNDAGQDVEIRPEKTYTIGRAVDNDVVLTDISVSRKHFDLKYENSAWVIVDRGSGNGTVVNGNLEDNPFMLASGDVIEIGNTVFRFEEPNGAPRVSAPTYDLDDEEMSTVAGKPLREPDPQPAPRPVLRPKTVPPPVPLRLTSRSTPPPIVPYSSSNPGLPVPYSSSNPALPVPYSSSNPALPASTMPMAQMANRAPVGPGAHHGPGSPTMLGDAMGMPMTGQPNLSSTMQGHGPSRPSYPYPQASEIPPHSVHAQMLMIQGQNRRGDLSTAHVPPVPFGGPMPMGAPSRGYAASPQLSRRAKLLLAGVALAVLTGIVTAAVVKSSDKPRAAAAAKAKATKAETAAKTQPKQARPTVEPIVTPAPKQDIKLATAPKPEPKAVTPTITQAQVPPPKQEPPKQEPPKQGPPKQEPPKQIATAPKPEPVKIMPKANPVPDKVQPVYAAKEPKPELKAERPTEPKTERKRESRREPTPKRVAAVDASAARDKADGLYRDRQFNQAASLLMAAAKSADEEEAKALRYTADMYTKLGKAYSAGTAPAQKANLAFEYLQSASTYDRNVGNHYDGDLQTKLAAVAPKAAIAYLGLKDYVKARNALIKAKQLGSSDSNLGLVKQKLEAIAGELYNEASKEIGSSPGAAKDKLRQVKQIVEPKSPWAVKADALLKKG